ncbi:MAG: hypothetical protein WDO24_05870 [Pseudomonadota bacterium]
MEFGSNPKSMTFPVVLIRFAEGVCTLYREPPGPGHRRDPHRQADGHAVPQARDVNRPS